MIEKEEKGVTAEFKPDYSIRFYVDSNTECGRLYKDENNRVRFEGNVHNSAKILFDEVCKMWDEEN